MALIEGEFAGAAQSVRRKQVLGHLGVSRPSFYRRRATGDEPSASDTCVSATARRN
jgi:predicted DNA-binding transcriptional regulator AlpA